MSQPMVLKAILTGPNAGKTGVYGGHKFVKGVHVMVGQMGEFQNRINLLRFYGAFLDGTDEFREAERLYGSGRIQEVPSVQPTGEAMGAEEGQDRSGVHPNEPASNGVSNGTGHDGVEEGQKGVLPTRTSEKRIEGDKPVDKRAQDTRSKKLKEILLLLDPKDDSHWTKAGIPLLSVVEQALGETGIVRADLEAALPGFDREMAGESF